MVTAVMTVCFSYAQYPTAIPRRQFGADSLVAFPTLVKYLVRNIDNPMAIWKVIATISGNIEAVSGAAAQGRPGTHKWTLWQGPAVGYAEALRQLDVALFEYQDCFR